ncbi:hypothetical protein Ddye_014370 [Dipteronia dyeriana]|uniref:Uncharacterized protein n=1 Tax=Dipteronia dyeriana TaxID=168575 RepID=A0AAD9X7Z3_9ROSI|nr:hypothetical protein Ddye_014370 [Dipteronia dyeriana]
MYYGSRWKRRIFDASGGKSPPCDGGGGGGGGSGESGDEGLSGVMDETVQVVLATIGFIFLELIRLAKDYIKYLFKGSKSVRLTSAMNLWGKFWKKLNEKKVYDNMWLEKAIINTPTWYDSPENYRRILRSYSAYKASSSDESDDD